MPCRRPRRAIARGEYQQVLARWGAGRSGAVGGQPAGDNLLTPVAWCAGWVSGKFLPTLRLYLEADHDNRLWRAGMGLDD